MQYTPKLNTRNRIPGTKCAEIACTSVSIGLRRMYLGPMDGSSSSTLVGSYPELVPAPLSGSKPPISKLSTS
eukprot:94201-Rhodomonas_salina.2